MSFTVSLTWNNPQKTISRFTKSRKLGIFLAETCARYMNPYVPMETGMLSQNVDTEPFLIIYNQTYANYQYNGDSFNFNHEKHPLATSHWDEPASKRYGSRIAKETTAFIERNGV